ncbi:dihydropteroate synthase [Brevundimonas basaltis]|uniref:Dihydropteroate synthase n=2 Tax=Brevundimonas basaltis TaxID=472166 RepID=A0A7W8MHX9_9CAUL|nr:dihydropteroate synthase [Brevundimonas basaltis]
MRETSSLSGLLDLLFGKKVPQSGPAAPAATEPVRVMGIVNVTPDSFSDGGRLATVDAAVAHGLTLVEQGADLLDIGGESTRPGADPASEAEEIARVIPVIEGLRDAWSGPLSVDTMKPAVARTAVAAGATMWNDVTALGHTPESLETAARLGCDIVLMHMRGEPRTMQADPRYGDVIAEVSDWLLARAEAAMAAGVARERIWLDPGVGFGKTPDHNLVLTARLGELAARGFPVLYGASRKRTIQSIDPTATDPADRLGGSLALALAAARNGAAILRVHDVRETVQALAVQAAIRRWEG